MADNPKVNTDQFSLGPWPAGMNNRAGEHELPAGTLRAAINVDITNSGRVRRRVGRTAVLEDTGCHSIFGYDDRFLFVRDGTLYLGLPPDHVQIASWADLPVSYVVVNEDIYLSNGQASGIVEPGGAVLRPWGVESAPPVGSLTAVAYGGMWAGTYQVAVTFVDDRGQEGGSSIASTVDVAEGGGITIAGLPQPLSSFADFINIYVSGPNDDKRFLHTTVPIGTTTATIGQSTTVGRAQDTMLLDQFPPSLMLEYYNGRIYGIEYFGNHTIVKCTRPLRYGAHEPSVDFILVPGHVSVMKASSDGIYIVSDEARWYEGSGPDEFKPDTVLPFGAVPGTGVSMGNSRDVAWFSKLGWVIGKPGGKVETVTDANVAVSEYTSGVALFREDRGLRQIVSALRGPTASSFKATDYADAEVIRAK